MTLPLNFGPEKSQDILPRGHAAVKSRRLPDPGSRNRLTPHENRAILRADETLPLLPEANRRKARQV